MLYTGVRLRSNKAAGPPPPEDHDPGLLWIETQCAAVPADPGGQPAARTDCQLAWPVACGRRCTEA